MKTSVLPVRDNALMQAFKYVPRLVYGDEIPPPANQAGMYLTPLNPVMQHLRFASFVAFQEGRPAGRITATVDTLNPRAGEGFWGCFECLDNPQIAKALLDAAAGWLKEQNKTVMIGPATLNTNQSVGLLIQGFEHKPLVEIPYNPPYYQKLVEEAGLETDQHLHCYKWELPEKLPEELERAEPVPGMVVRPANYRAIAREAALYRDFHNRSMSENWGFIPITPDDARGTVENFARRVPPELFAICELKGKVVCMGISIPYQAPGRDGGGLIRHAIGGVLPEYRGKGVHRLLIRELFRQCKRLGFTSGEGSQVAESNQRILGKVVHPLYGREIIKLYRVYRRPLA